jgi:hypothetical protein
MRRITSSNCGKKRAVSNHEIIRVAMYTYTQTIRESQESVTGICSKPNPSLLLILRNSLHIAGKA